MLPALVLRGYDWKHVSGGSWDRDGGGIYLRRQGIGIECFIVGHEETRQRIREVCRG